MIDSETSKPSDLASGPIAHSHHFHFVVRYNGACCEVSGWLRQKALTTKAQPNMLRSATKSERQELQLFTKPGDYTVCKTTIPGP